MEIEVRENIVTQGLSLYLDARSGFGTDLSGNSNIPSLSNNIYDGESYQLTINSINTLDGTNLNLTGGQFTLESWIYYGGNSLSGSYGQIFTQDTGSTIDGQGWQWRVSNSNKQIEFIYWTSSSRSSAVGFSYATPLVSGNWYHLVVSYDGTNIKGYINGSLDVTHTPSSALYGSTATIGIGRFSSLQYEDVLNGKIAVIRGYKNYYLSDKQIQSNYINQRGRFFGQGSFSVETRENIVTNGLVNYLNVANRNSYPGSGTTWYDLSGNNRNGTISGSYSDGSLFFNPGYVEFSQYNFGNEFTFIAFINPTTKNTISALFANSSSGSFTNGIRIFINFDGANTRTLHIELGNGSSSQLITSASNTVTYGVWQQVAFTLNKSTAKGAIYHNGIKVKEDNLNFTNFNSNDRFDFGTIRGAYSYLGRLSSFITYNRALTSAEIQKNYIQGYSADSLSLF
jgi:hypothetical protein